VANFFLGGSMTSGASIKISISPITGVNTETTILHTFDRTFIIKFHIGSENPGTLQCFEKGRLTTDLNAVDFSRTTDDSILSGFDNENISFFSAVREGRQPADTFASCQQSVEVMQAMRERQAEYHI
jgi:hypothetical protein